jgi:hypothetical protein
MENFLILNPPKLTYIGLQEFGGNNGIAATLIILSKKPSHFRLIGSRLHLLEPHPGQIGQNEQHNVHQLVSHENYT